MPEIYAAALRPFVYRRYLDYGVFESLREMKALIEREVQRRELAGRHQARPGGIREIEFIVQAFQLIRGGRERHLQTTSLRQALAAARRAAAAAGHGRGRAARGLRVPAAAGEPPADARRPASAPASRRRALARARSRWPWAPRIWAPLLAELGRHRACVSGHFNALRLRRRASVAATTVSDRSRPQSGRRRRERAACASRCARAGFAGSRAQAAQMLLAASRASALVRRSMSPAAAPAGAAAGAAGGYRAPPGSPAPSSLRCCAASSPFSRPLASAPPISRCCARIARRARG